MHLLQIHRNPNTPEEDLHFDKHEKDSTTKVLQNIAAVHNISSFTVPLLDLLLYESIVWRVC
jgi:hypothetical protein